MMNLHCIIVMHSQSSRNNLRDDYGKVTCGCSELYSLVCVAGWPFLDTPGAPMAEPSSMQSTDC